MIPFYISGKSLAVADKHAAAILVTTCFQLSFSFIYFHLPFVWILAVLAVGVGGVSFRFLSSEQPISSVTSQVQTCSLQCARVLALCNKHPAVQARREVCGSAILGNL